MNICIDITGGIKVPRGKLEGRGGRQEGGGALCLRGDAGYIALSS